MRKRWWKMGHARDQAQSWGWKVKSVGACMALCVCVCVLEILALLEFWNHIGIHGRTLVEVKLMLATDEIQGTWVYLQCVIWSFLGTWEGLTFMALTDFGCKSSTSLWSLKILWNFWNFWIEILNQAWGFFPLKTLMSWNKNKISKKAWDPLYGIWFNESKIHTRNLE